MKNDKTNNQHAFPQHFIDNKHGGITMRDYFAAKALSGFISDREQYIALCNDARREKTEIADYLAYSCYLVADAMLKQRES